MLKFASTQKLYEEIIRNEIKKEFIIPAFNLKTLAFETARALFRAAKKEKVGAFIIELAKSEIKYTNQPLNRYDNVILMAAQKEKFNQPIFLQADHFKIKDKKEIEDLKILIKKAIKNNFYNIDIDCSSLPIKDNYALTAEFTKFIRKIEPKDLTISIGAEVGEIGGKNTTPNELKKFIEGYKKLLPSNLKGIIKIAVQTGTSHGLGGKVDFKLLKRLGQEVRKYGLAGVVQHGASMLPEKEFPKFLKTGVCEIHLATLFQDIVYDSKYFPQNLREKIYQWLKKNYTQQRKEEEKEEEFFHRVRKNALGPFKKEISSLPQKNIKKISQEIEEKAVFFFKTFKVSHTAELIKKIYSE